MRRSRIRVSVQDVVFAVVTVVVFAVWDVASSALRARRRGDVHGRTGQSIGASTGVAADLS
ncbi:hypothetical protein [Gordonia oryzae]|uniref:hypothetical protein n=1 Tax=Gordonia oryzae TaxID=2487349 RepID=UPI001FEB2D97|nr:hypothetical protein [Gordonia oryzae]